MTSTADDTKHPSIAATGAATASTPSSAIPEPKPVAEVRPQPMPQTTPQPRSDAAPAAAARAATQAAAPAQAPPVQPATSAPPPAAAAGRPQPGRFRRFVRSLFTHVLFASASVAAVLGYLYHEPILRDVSSTVCAPEVLGQWMPRPASSTAGLGASKTAPTMAPVVPPAAAPVAVAAPPVPPLPSNTAAKPADEITAKPTAAATPMAPTAPSAAAVTANVPTSTTAAPTAAVAPSAEAVKKAEPAKSAPSAVAAAQPQPAAGPSTPAPAKPASEPDATKATGITTAATTPAGPTSLQVGWAAARKAFADGNPEAIAAYGDLAKRFPDNPDLTGELGNILFQQGKLTEAGEQFYETGLRLIRAKQEVRAACLAEVLDKLAPEKARELLRRAGTTCPVAMQ